ncbi:MAG: hypothetical protein VW985_02620 [Gammaproteobacteria bacterium]
MVLTLIGLFYAGTSAAQPAFVIDTLWIGVTAAPQSNEVIQLIPSGEQVEVEAIVEGQAKIATTSGTVGWVDASYLTEHKPLSTQLEKLELTIRNDSQNIAQALSRLQTLETTARPLRGNQSATNSWLVIAASGVSIAVVAFLTGVGWRNRRLRRKFGGLLP